MANPTNFRLTPFGGLIENAHVEILNYYLYQIYSGSNKNQSEIVSGVANTDFGLTVVNNWEIYDGISPARKLVAHAKGLHIEVADWYNSFTMVFDGDRYKGSTIQVMGGTIERLDDWSIIGGTGQFEYARGVIKRKLYQRGEKEAIYGLSIEFYFSLKIFPKPTMNGPWGREDAGTASELREMPWRLESVTITYYGLIDEFSYTYINQHGKKRTVDPWRSGWAHEKSQTQMITLAPSEFLKEVSGEFEPDTSNLQSITFISNIETYGPFGALDRSDYPKGTLFKFAVDDVEKSCIVGFYGTTDDHIKSFGVYTV